MWRRFLHHPQDLRLRRLLFQVHLWTGVALGLYIVLIGVTGASLVFRHELEHALDPPIPGAPTTLVAAHNLPGIADDLRRRFPDRTLAAIVPPSEEHPIVRGYLHKDGGYLIADVHPTSGQVLRTTDAEASFLRWLQHLHFDLLSGRTGRVVNGVGAVFLLLMCCTGLVIWWPGMRNWRRSTRVDFSRRWKRVNWDLHSATGFWTAALLSTWAISGIYFAWPREFAGVVNYLSPVSLANVPKPDIASKGKVSPPQLDALIADAVRRSPGAALLSISFAVNEKGYLRVFMARERPLAFETSDYHYFDPFTGKHLVTWRRGHDQTAGDVFLSWIGPLHFGSFGGHGAAGIAVKILWTLLGLTPPVLAISGFLMYWNRYLSKRWRAAIPVAEPEPVEAMRP